MYIHRGIGKKLDLWATENGRMVITARGSTAGGRCESVRVSLTPPQAIKVANDLMCPPEHQPVELMDGTSELRPMWQVYKVKHGNGVTRGMVGISDDKGPVLGLNDNFMSYDKTEDKTRVTDYFCCTAVKLTRKEVKTVAGLLFLWAGSELVGTRKVCETTTRHILNVEDEA